MCDFSTIVRVCIHPFVLIPFETPLCLGVARPACRLVVAIMLMGKVIVNQSPMFISKGRERRPMHQRMQVFCIYNIKFYGLACMFDLEKKTRGHMSHDSPPPGNQ
jgi:hypothetical protein